MQQRLMQTEDIPSHDMMAAEDETLDLLPEEFSPGKWDVICQRGKECYDHVGNRRFRMIIESHLGTYMEVMSRRQKTRIVSTIVKNIRAAAEESGGGFVRKDLLTRRWFKVSDKLAREKVGQALRDAIKTRKSSSSGGSQSKAAKRSSKKNISATQGLTNMIDEQSIQLPLSPVHVQGVHTFDTVAKSLNSPTPNSVPSSTGSGYSHQMVADLEPTPLRAQSMSYSGLFDRSSMAHQRSESSASTLLRLFDEKNNAGMIDPFAVPKNAMEAAAVQAATAAATQSRRLSLSQMTFHPIADTSLLSVKNDFRFF